MAKWERLLSVHSIRKAIGRLRLRYFVHVRRRWTTLESDQAFDRTVSHNLKGLQDFDNRRIQLLTKPLSVLEVLDRDSKILVLGPRNENDLLDLAGNGFKLKNLRGLDLISYSPRIDAGDMHSMPYEDGSFDAVIGGWVISYSKEPEVVAREMLRIVKPGGVVAVAVEYSSLTHEEAVEAFGYDVADPGFERVNSVQQILALFGDRVDEVYFRHDAPRKISHRPGARAAKPSAAAVIFSVSGGSVASEPDPAPVGAPARASTGADKTAEPA